LLTYLQYSNSIGLYKRTHKNYIDRYCRIFKARTTEARTEQQTTLAKATTRLNDEHCLSISDYDLSFAIPDRTRRHRQDVLGSSQGAAVYPLSHDNDLDSQPNGITVTGIDHAMDRGTLCPLPDFFNWRRQHMICLSTDGYEKNC